MFKVNSLRFEHFPDTQCVERALSDLGLPNGRLRDVLQNYGCSEPRDIAGGEGYQIALARHLGNHLKKTLPSESLNLVNKQRYSERLGYNADIVLRRPGIQRAIFVEIEFRPNVEKDLVKFQIGWNSSMLGAAVLLLALRRETINPDYGSMPEFDNFLKVIKELRPDYPLLLCGIGGAQEFTPLRRPIQNTRARRLAEAEDLDT
ncbi:MAG: hypothetical protein HYS41_07465 [Candidatus Omnitrophica bacterium]|nr:hypothetical protein [Candidatus Omnitrophota bacterium]